MQRVTGSQFRNCSYHVHPCTFLFLRVCGADNIEGLHEHSSGEERVAQTGGRNSGALDECSARFPTRSPKRRNTAITTKDQRKEATAARHWGRTGNLKQNQVAQAPCIMQNHGLSRLLSAPFSRQPFSSVTPCVARSPGSRSRVLERVRRAGAIGKAQGFPSSPVSAQIPLLELYYFSFLHLFSLFL